MEAMMTKEQTTFGLSALLPLLAAGVFVAFGGEILSTPVGADGGSCTPGICEKNGCTEKAQYCNSKGDGWLACGTC
jgi:hypothetical protein